MRDGTNYRVALYRRGTLVGTEKGLLLRDAKEAAQRFVRAELADGNRVAAAYVFYRKSMAHTYACGVNRAGKLYGRAAL